MTSYLRSWELQAESSRAHRSIIILAYYANQTYQKAHLNLHASPVHGRLGHSADYCELNAALCLAADKRRVMSWVGEDKEAVAQVSVSKSTWVTEATAVRCTVWCLRLVNVLLPDALKTCCFTPWGNGHPFYGEIFTCFALLMSHCKNWKRKPCQETKYNKRN